MNKFKSTINTCQHVFASLLVFIFMLSGSSYAHEIRPSLMDIGLAPDDANSLEIRLSFTAESYLAGMDLSDLSDTNNSPVASEYDRLRALSSQEISRLMEDAFQSLSQDVSIRLDQQPLTWVLKDIRTEEIDDQEIIRETKVIFTASVPDSMPLSSFDKQASITVTWPENLGGLLIRQHGDGSDSNYVEFLQMGGESLGFAIGEIYQPSILNIIQRYIHSGIIHIVPYGLDHILFVIGILAFSRSGHHLLLQISLFTVAHTLTLAAASLGWIYISPKIIEPLIALSIAYIGVENLMKTSPHLTMIRGGIVFAFGLLHGLGFASVLADFGLPDAAFITALISFNIGVEIGQLIIVLPLFILFRFILIKSVQYRYVFQVPVSIIIALIGMYWAIERIGLI